MGTAGACSGGLCARVSFYFLRGLWYNNPKMCVMRLAANDAARGMLHGA